MFQIGKHYIIRTAVISLGGPGYSEGVWKVTDVQGTLLSLLDAGLDRLMDAIDAENSSAADILPPKSIVLNTASLFFHSAEETDPPGHQLLDNLNE